MTGTPPNPRGRLMIISGPSGVGKSTLTNALRDRVKAFLSISMTTRPLGRGDITGEHYHFVDDAAFDHALADQNLLEWAEVYGQRYGTPKTPVIQALEAGRFALLEIDQVGAAKVKQQLPDALAVFILPPSEDALLARLRSRKREDEAAIQRRYARAQDEIAAAKASPVYDAFLVNDDFDRALAEMERLIRDQVSPARSA
ncbi:MAG: guanylate kinase [Planctomycetota bacterium]